MKIFFLSVFIGVSVFATFAPMQVFAQSTSGTPGIDPPQKQGYLIFCNTSIDQTTGKINDPCTFDRFIELAVRIMDLAMYLVVPLAALSFAYAGYELVVSQGNAAALTKAKGILWKVVVGIFFILAGWLIIHSLLAALVDPSYSIIK